MRPSLVRLAAGPVLALAAGFLAAGTARAGDITAALEKQTLVLRGDDLGSALVLSRPDPAARGQAVDSAVLISPLGKATTVNGTPQAAVFSPVENLRIELGDGLDTTQIIGLDLAGELFLDAGAGNNQLYLGNASFAGKCTFQTGDDPDVLTVENASGCGDDVKILLGEGINELRLLPDSSFGDDVSVKLGSNDDEVALNAAIAGSVKLSLGEGNNTLNAPGSVGDDFSCKSGAGADTLNLGAFDVGGHASLKPGSGSNTLLLGPATVIVESLKWKSGSGNDTVAADGLQIGDDAAFILSAGDNTVSLMNATIGDDLIVKAKGGADTLALGAGNTISGETVVKGVP